MSFVLMVGMFFLYALILWAAFNYSVPKVLLATDKNYVETDYRDLTYINALGLAVLISLVVAPLSLDRHANELLGLVDGPKGRRGSY